MASERAAPFHLVEGNAELTPAPLVGHFDPAQVLARAYTPDVFVDGPLVSALRDGGCCTSRRSTGSRRRRSTS